jgi:CHAD domain-containing protein
MQAVDGVIFLSMKGNLLQHHLQTLIDNATQESKDLSSPKDSEALHDFRVSLRRLRSFLKSYESALGKKSKQHRQHLGELMRLTNSGRDQEVNLNWLHQQQKVSAEIKTGIALIKISLEKYPTLDRRKLQKQFAKQAAKLKQLAKKTHFKGNFNLLTSSILNKYTGTLKTELSQLAKDPNLVHQTRITVKHLRYSLELLDAKESKALVNKLKELQDTLGGLNDLGLLIKHLDELLMAQVIHLPQRFIATSSDPNIDQRHLPELEQAFALAALKKYILAMIQDLQKELKKNWFGRSNAVFFRELKALCKTLAKTPDPSL